MSCAVLRPNFSPGLAAHEPTADRIGDTANDALRFLGRDDSTVDDDQLPRYILEIRR